MSEDFVKEQLNQIFTIKINKIKLTKFGYYKFELINGNKGKADYIETLAGWLIKWACGNSKGTIKPK